MNIMKLENICKQYDETSIFHNFTIEIPKQKVVVITGESGCGKSTLLNIMGLLEDYEDGQMYYFEKNITGLTKKKKILYYRHQLGYLFQNYALMEQESVMTNLKLALRYAKIPKKQHLHLIRNALDEVGLSGFENKMIYQLSGGEQQRVAIARLFLKPCELILADEPTGSLDKRNKYNIIKLLLSLKEKGKTIVIVTHDDDFIQIADLHIRLEKAESEALIPQI